MKVAIVHDWLTGMRGGERCLEVFCELFPGADIYTLLHFSGTVSPLIERHSIRTSFLQHLPFVRSSYRHYLPLFPLAVERFNLEGYDLVLSSSHCVAKNIRVPEAACHISYTYTPMRYIWDQYDFYFGKGRANWPVRAAMRVFRPWLQKTDVQTSRRVHHFVAISHHVARRIQRYYGREATVIYPPVDLSRFSPSQQDDGYYLMVTAFAPYKRVDLAIEAFNQLQLPLKIIGSGQDEVRLRRLAGPTIEFCGWLPDMEVQQAYAACRALIFPGEEDFGIVPVEAMASGKPVIAYGKGGALETVVPLSGVPGMLASSGEIAVTGVLFDKQTMESLMGAVKSFETQRDHFEPERIRAHAERFGKERFKTEIAAFVEKTLASHRS